MSPSCNQSIFSLPNNSTNTPFSRCIRVVLRNPRCHIVLRPFPSSQHRSILRNGRTSYATSSFRPCPCPFGENHSPSMGQLGQRQYRLAEWGNRPLQRKYTHDSRIIERGWTSYHLDTPLEELVPSPLQGMLPRTGSGI